MVEREKKRHQSPTSPECTTPAKRGRHSADEVSVRSASHALSHDDMGSRTEPGIYIPGRPSSGATPLSNADDWSFRVQVISSTTTLSDDIFEKAIQGLVKICFPEGVLEELGIKLLAEHMHKEKASEDSIVRMRHVFSSEMITCISGMLAQYLDSSTKLKSALQSILEASTALHPEAQTETFRDIMRTLTSKTGTPVRDSTSLQISNAIQRTDDPDGDWEGMIVDAEEPPAVNEPCPPRSKKDALANRKVSASWRWNIVVEDISAEVVKNKFIRPSDLFAFHALPVAKDLLAAEATRKELRLSMQEILDGMSDNVYEQWVLSFHRLREGDETMLVRVPPETKRNGRTATTPAPLVGRTTVGYSDHSSHNRVRKRKRIKGRSDTEHDKAFVKHETQVHDDFQANIVTARDEPRLPGDQTLTEQDALGPSTLSKTSTERHLSGLSSLTPVVDLLWGRETLLDVSRFEIVSRIHENLRKRTSLKSVTITKLDGSWRVTTMNALLKRMRGDAQIVTKDNKARSKLEELLRPWVIEDPSGFPELVTEPFIFADMMQLVTPVLDIVYSTQAAMAAHCAHEVELEISSALCDRKIEDVSLFKPGAVSLSSHIKSCVTNATTLESVKRRSIEKYLRRIAFHNRDKFPELAQSQLVRFWEQCTGSKW